MGNNRDFKGNIGEIIGILGKIGGKIRDFRDTWRANRDFLGRKGRKRGVLGKIGGKWGV